MSRKSRKTRDRVTAIAPEPSEERLNQLIKKYGLNAPPGALREFLAENSGGSAPKPEALFASAEAVVTAIYDLIDEDERS